MTDEHHLPSGVEVFRSHRGRFTNSAHVDPNGELGVGTGSYMGGGCWRGHQPEAFVNAPEDLLRELAAAIESGAVWEHVRRAIERQARRT